LALSSILFLHFLLSNNQGLLKEKERELKKKESRPCPHYQAVIFSLLLPACPLIWAGKRREKIKDNRLMVRS
jgi:hypothetical protein